MCMYVCMYMCMYVCMCAYVCMHAHVFVSVYIRMCVYVCVSPFCQHVVPLGSRGISAFNIGYSAGGNFSYSTGYDTITVYPSKLP